MDHDLSGQSGDKSRNDVTNKTTEASKREMNKGVSPMQDLSCSKNDDINMEPHEGRMEKETVGVRNEDITGEVNMEAAISTDDVIRAGGFGARDDMSSLLPAAIDSTDFEASLLDARYYEGPQGEISRPGLGWTEPKNM